MIREYNARPRRATQFVIGRTADGRFEEGWAKYAHLSQLYGVCRRPLAERVYVGAWVDKKGRLNYLRHNNPEHELMHAPTRSGKGGGLVIPTLLSRPGSAIITDLKGELWAMTENWRQIADHYQIYTWCFNITVVIFDNFTEQYYIRIYLSNGILFLNKVDTHTSGHPYRNAASVAKADNGFPCCAEAIADTVLAVFSCTNSYRI